MRTTEAMAEALIEMRRQPGCDGQDQFWQIAERFRAGLVNHALAILGSQSDAEDVAQDTLCRAFLDLHKLDNPRKLGRWLRAINRLNALQFLRKQKARKEERLATGQAAALTKDRMPHRSLTPPSGVEQEEEEEQVVKAVDALPEPFRDVIVLYYWEKMTLVQIAEQLGVPTGTVRSRVARADGMLVRKLKMFSRSEEPPQ